MKKNYLLAKGAFLLLMGLQMNSAHAQQKIGGAVGASDASALLHLGDLNPAVKKGLLMPRVQLSATNVWGLAGATPVEGMHVYNTATAGTGATAVTPGEFYWDGNGWIRLVSSVASQSITGNGTPVGQSGLNPVKGMIYTDVDDVTPSPTLGQQWTYDGTTWISYNAPAATEWYLAGGTSDAGGNKTLGIYRTGKVGIGTTAPKAILDVSGDALINGITMGRGVGNSNTNTIVGLAAFAKNAGGTQNTAVGAYAMKSNTSGYQNTAVGYTALQSNTQGTLNVALGHYSLQGNTLGSYNTAVNAALSNNIDGNENVGVGLAALGTNDHGSGNTGVGRFSLQTLTGTGSDNNTALGYKAGDNQTAGANNIVIGANTDLPNLTGSNQLSIGNLIYGTGVTGASAGNIGIGTPAPAAKFHVVAPTGTASEIIETNADNTPDYRSTAANGAGYSLFTTYSRTNYSALTNNPVGGFMVHSGGIDGTKNTAGVLVRAAENHTPTATGTFIQFYTNPLGVGNNIIERMRIAPDGSVGLGTTAPVEKLDVKGAMRLGTVAAYNITTNGQATPDPAGGAGSGGAGTIAYSNGHFWGYIPTSATTGVWKQLDN